MTPAATTASAPPGYSVKGIDIASYQKSVQWGSVAAAGYQFAYVKATESTNYINPYFDQQYNGAKAAGLFVGAYVFARPDGNASAQADYFYEHSGYVRDGRTLPLMLDMEYPYGSLANTYNDCWNLKPAAMITWIRTFVDTIRQLSGSPVLIYTGTGWWKECTGNTAQFANQYLNTAYWSPGPPPLPAGWTTWTVWQYSSTGSVPGISGSVDLDVFNGTSGQLQELALSPWAASGVTAVWTGSQYQVFGHNPGGGVQLATWTGSRWVASGLGGVTAGAPAVTYHSGRYDVFAVSSSGSLFQRTFSTRWDSWHRIATGFATSGLSAVWTGSQYHVFGHTPDGHLQQAAWTGSQWIVQDLGGITVGTPASTYHSGRYDVFAVSPSGSLYQRTFAGHWDTWHRIGTGFATSGLSAVWTGSLYQVFGHNSAGQIQLATWTGSRWTQSNLGGATSGTPATTYHSGRYDLFAVSPSGWLYQRTFASQWGAWHRIA